MKKILSLFFTILAFSQVQGNVSWTSPPTNISGVNANAGNPILAMDENGNSVAVWIENNRIKASSHLLNGNWTPEATVSAVGASAPDLVIDSNGNSTLIWLGSSVVYASSKTLNGNWTNPIALSNAGASSPTLGVDSSGNVIAAWVRGGNIESRTKLFGLNWQTRATIASSSASTPCVAIGGTGNNTRAVLVWQGNASGNKVIYTSTKVLPGNWTTQEIISSDMHNAANPKVSLDSNANAIALWYEYDVTGVSNTNVVLMTSERLSTTNDWNCPVALSEPGIRNPATLSSHIAFDSLGNAVAVWNTSFDDETFSIQSSVKPVNGEWSKAQNIIDSNLFAYNESIAVTSFGDTVGVFMYFNGADLLIQTVETNINGYMNNVWSVPMTLSLGSENGYPKVAAIFKGNKIYATCLWVTSGGVADTVYAVTGTQNLVLPPSNLTVSQSANNYGVFTEYSNTLQWTASTDPNAVGYLIFRNGLFLEQVGLDVLSYTDHNRTLNGAVKYSIAAINAQQEQSGIVSVNLP